MENHSVRGCNTSGNAGYTIKRNIHERRHLSRERGRKILTNLGLVKRELPRIHDVDQALPQRVGIVPPPVHEGHPSISGGGLDLIEHGMVPTAGQAE